MNKTARLRSIAVVLSLALLAACAPPPQVYVKKAAAVRELKLHVSYDAGIPPAVVNDFNGELDDFIAEYNGDSRHKLVLARSEACDERCLTVRIASARFAGALDQVLGFLGFFIIITSQIALAEGKYYAGSEDVYIPVNSTRTEYSLSDDISSRKGVVTRDIFSSLPWFGGLATQRERQKREFRDYLRELLKKMEYEL